MWIRLFSFLSLAFAIGISTNINAQISIYSNSGDHKHKTIYNSALTGHTKLHIPENNILQFHDPALHNLTTEFIHNDIKLWDFHLNRSENIFHDLEINQIIDYNKSITKKGVQISNFEGILVNNNESKVFLTIIESKFELVIIDGNNNYNISWSQDQDAYVYQSFDSQQKNKSDLKCSIHAHAKAETEIKTSNTNKSIHNSCQEINLQFYTDYLFFKEYDQNIELGLLKIVSTVSQIQQDYEVFNINFNVNAIQFSTCQNCDPWIDSQDASDLLYDFDLKTDSVEDNSIKLLLTGRPLNNLFVGMARFNSFCSEDSKVVIQNITSSTWQQRVIVSHEIGHILGSNHDDSINNIMSSSLNNTSEWTSNTINIIQQSLSSSTCLTDCSNRLCPKITDIQITEKNSDELVIDWISDLTSTIHYELIHMGSKEIIASGFSDAQIIATNLFGCEEYELKLIVECDNGETNTYSKMISTSTDQDISISQIEILNCNQDDFDLKLLLSHQLISEEDISVQIGDQEWPFRISQNTSFVIIDSLDNFGQKDAGITISTVGSFHNLCSSKTIYDMPENDCSIQWEENFDQGKLPDFWTLDNSNHDFFTSSYSWKVDDSDREIANYNYGYHATNGATINGTNMMYMDDDYLAFNSYTGTTSLLSPIIDLSQYRDVAISFDYIFHKFIEKGENESYFTIDVWSGDEWIQVFDAEQTSCSWFEIWENHCSTSADIDLSSSSYSHSSFQMRFNYSDGANSKWTGMAAFDNFRLEASIRRFRCLDVDQISINDTNQSEQHDHQQCETECTQDFLLINSYPNTYSASNINRIEATGIIDQSDVNLAAQTYIELSQGFSIESGSTILLDIQKCIN